MSDNIVRFDNDTTNIVLANKVRSILGVDKDTGLPGAVDFNLLVQESGKNVADAVKLTGNVLPSLGDANKRYSFTTGSLGRTLTHGATSLVYSANRQCSAFWDGVTKVWSKEDEVELPKGGITESEARILSKYTTIKDADLNILSGQSGKKLSNLNIVSDTVATSFLFTYTVPKDKNYYLNYKVYKLSDSTFANIIGEYADGTFDVIVRAGIVGWTLEVFLDISKYSLIKFCNDSRYNTGFVAEIFSSEGNLITVDNYSRKANDLLSIDNISKNISDYRELSSIYFTPRKRLKNTNETIDTSSNKDMCLYKFEIPAEYKYLLYRSFQDLAAYCTLILEKEDGSFTVIVDGNNNRETKEGIVALNGYKYISLYYLSDYDSRFFLLKKGFEFDKYDSFFNFLKSAKIENLFKLNYQNLKNETFSALDLNFSGNTKQYLTAANIIQSSSSLDNKVLRLKVSDLKFKYLTYNLIRVKNNSNANIIGEYADGNYSVIERGVTRPYDKYISGNIDISIYDYVNIYWVNYPNDSQILILSNIKNIDINNLENREYSYDYLLDSSHVISDYENEKMAHCPHLEIDSKNWYINYVYDNVDSSEGFNLRASIGLIVGSLANMYKGKKYSFGERGSVVGDWKFNTNLNKPSAWEPSIYNFNASYIYNYFWGVNELDDKGSQLCILRFNKNTNSFDTSIIRTNLLYSHEGINYNVLMTADNLNQMIARVAPDNINTFDLGLQGFNSYYLYNGEYYICTGGNVNSTLGSNRYVNGGIILKTTDFVNFTYVNILPKSTLNTLYGEASICGVGNKAAIIIRRAGKMEMYSYNLATNTFGANVKIETNVSEVRPLIINYKNELLVIYNGSEDIITTSGNSNRRTHLRVLKINPDTLATSSIVDAQAKQGIHYIDVKKDIYDRYWMVFTGGRSKITSLNVSNIEMVNFDKLLNTKHWS